MLLVIWVLGDVTLAMPIRLAPAQTYSIDCVGRYCRSLEPLVGGGGGWTPLPKFNFNAKKGCDHQNISSARQLFCGYMSILADI